MEFKIIENTKSENMEYENMESENKESKKANNAIENMQKIIIFLLTKTKLAEEIQKIIKDNI